MPQMCGRGLSVLGGGKVVGDLVFTVMVALEGPASSATVSAQYDRARPAEAAGAETGTERGRHGWRSVQHTGLVTGRGGAGGRRRLGGIGHGGRFELDTSFVRHGHCRRRQGQVRFGGSRADFVRWDGEVASVSGSEDEGGP